MGAGDVAVDGEVIECDPPRKLVQTWRMVMIPEAAAEGFTRLTYEIGEAMDGVSKLTVIHELEGAPKLALMVAGGLEDTGAGGGWNWVLCGLKTLLETGATTERSHRHVLTVDASANQRTNRGYLTRGPTSETGESHGEGVRDLHPHHPGASLGGHHRQRDEEQVPVRHPHQVGLDPRFALRDEQPERPRAPGRR